MDFSLDSGANDMLVTYEREGGRFRGTRAPRQRRGETQAEFRGRYRLWEEGEREAQKRALLEP